MNALCIHMRSSYFGVLGDALELLGEAVFYLNAWILPPIIYRDPVTLDYPRYMDSVTFNELETLWRRMRIAIYYRFDGAPEPHMTRIGLRHARETIQAFRRTVLGIVNRMAP